jgi:hypothetical protein
MIPLQRSRTHLQSHYNDILSFTIPLQRRPTVHDPITTLQNPFTITLQLFTILLQRSRIHLQSHYNDILSFTIPLQQRPTVHDPITTLQNPFTVTLQRRPIIHDPITTTSYRSRSHYNAPEPIYNHITTIHNPITTL